MRLAIALAIATAAAGTGCRGEDRAAARARPAALVPALPRSEDGVAALRGLDERIRIHDTDPARLAALELERAAITGTLDDYTGPIALTDWLIRATPNDAESWQLRVQALARVHRFAEARTAFATWRTLSPDPWAIREAEVSLDEATGAIERALAERASMSLEWPRAEQLVGWAGALAEAGMIDEALAVMPRAVRALRDNAPELISWLAFRWGRLYEQRGEPAAARAFYAVAHERLPGAVDTTAHLAQAMIASGDRAAARTLVDEALASNRHPELVALAAQLADAAHAPALVAEARAGWERYVAALPEAFADHAARFYLAVGADPARALVLARQNLANRDTRDARALVIDAALAVHDPAAACAVVEPLIAGRATHAQQFAAWRALAACGRDADAERVATTLGITP